MFRGGSKSRQSDGGKAIASGGYGCVFRPAIACKGETNPRPDSISKLMLKDKAEDEMEEIEEALKLVKGIPNYSKYFALTDYHMCVPGKITKEDEKSFIDQCINPLGVTSEYVKKDPSDYRLVVSPDLGKDLSKALKDMFTRARDDKPGSAGYQHLIRNLINLNNTSYDFLKNGIAKMAKVGLYHADVKPQNVMTNYNRDLAKPSFTEMKLIDYGLVLPPGADAAYSVNSFVMFNAPFSMFMFGREVKDDINRLLKNEAHVYEEDKIGQGGNQNRYEGRISAGMERIINDHVFSYARDHIPYMESIGSRAFGISTSKYRSSFRNVFIDYCTVVVLDFTDRTDKKRPRFNAVKYWVDVLQYNLDVWGFLTSFLLLASYSQITHPSISDDYLSIVSNYLYTPVYAARKIPVGEVLAALDEMTSRFQKQLKPAAPAVAPAPVAAAPVKKIVFKPKKATSRFQKQLKSAAPVPAVVPAPVAAAPVKKIVFKPKKATKTKKKRLVIVKEFKSAEERPARSVVTLKSNQKRCPKGYVRHKKDKTKCIKSGTKTKKVIKEGITLVGKRCAKGYVRDKKDKTRCVKSGTKTKKVIKEGITLVGKRCPKGYKRHKTEKGRCVANTKK